MLSEDLKDWFSSFSQSAAVDMCEGGDDPELVAEQCVTCISTYEPALHVELQGLFTTHGYQKVMKDVERVVCTL